MKEDELKKATEDILVQMLTPGLKDVIDRLVGRGATVPQVREIMQYQVRRQARRENTMTELAIHQYLDNLERAPERTAPQAERKPETATSPATSNKK